MKAGVVLYQSKYGAAKRYAQWLAETLDFDCMDMKQADTRAAAAYDTIILGSGVYASGTAATAFLRKHFADLRGKKIAVFCVGAAPFDEGAFRRLVEQQVKDDLKAVPYFYCRGMLDTGRMAFADRLLCTMLQKAAAKKAPAARNVLETALMDAADQPCDWTDKAYLQPIIDFVRG